jgi:hypothetical protein
LRERVGLKITAVDERYGADSTHSERKHKRPTARPTATPGQRAAQSPSSLIIPTPIRIIVLIIEWMRVAAFGISGAPAKHLLGVHCLFAFTHMHTATLHTQRMYRM